MFAVEANSGDISGRLNRRSSEMAKRRRILAIVTHAEDNDISGVDVLAD